MFVTLDSMADDGVRDETGVDGVETDGDASLPIVQLWVNGAAVKVDGARLARGAGGVWRVDAALPDHSPFRQEFGLSMVLADGRTAHGRARLCDADGDRVTFEGVDLQGTA